MMLPYPKGFHDNKVWDFYIVLGYFVVIEFT
jgi:hypothetical protein